jgi:hypothetical protein
MGPAPFCAPSLPGFGEGVVREDDGWGDPSRADLALVGIVEGDGRSGDQTSLAASKRTHHIPIEMREVPSQYHPLGMASRRRQDFRTKRGTTSTDIIAFAAPVSLGTPLAAKCSLSYPFLEREVSNQVVFLAVPLSQTPFSACKGAASAGGA